ncbi:hypothetical protein NUACC21_01880 [Scytonema sp. NUACC21]
MFDSVAISASGSSTTKTITTFNQDGTRVIDTTAFDAQSIAPTDLVAGDLVYRDRVGETYAVTYNPEHRWFYFPQMQKDEALLIKCFDSAEDGRARFTAHTAFDDPTSPSDAPPRESIELRTLVFYPT